MPRRMKSSPGLHFKTYLLILIMVILGPLGNVFLGKGMRAIGAVTDRSPAALLRIFGQILTSDAIWLGIASLIGFFVAYMLVLSWADYSYVQPASSFAYVVVALLGHLVLHEIVTPTRWLGVLVICLGVFVVGQTPPRTTEHG
jgi:drug/metabolite transporter (DMT)-like permease